jgi:hypothetical protein
MRERARRAERDLPHGRVPARGSGQPTPRRHVDDSTSAAAAQRRAGIERRQ